jgi:hypothetical protein
MEEVDKAKEIEENIEAVPTITPDIATSQGEK